jgi:hypothetical protein
MKSYFVSYHTPVDVFEQMQKESKEKKQERRQAWMNWYQENKNNLVDYGSPLIEGKVLGKNGISPSNINFSGYFIIQAEDIDEAVVSLQNHPHLLSDESCTLEIHEIMQMP